MKVQMQALVEERQREILDTLCTLNATAAKKDRWKRKDGGGGITAVLPKGRVFDNGGVNVSTVHGACPPKLLTAAGVSADDEALTFFATGISLVLHPSHPMIPTVHANYRYFELWGKDANTPLQWWFGGGSDLTPAYLFEEDVKHFHLSLKEACDNVDRNLYPRLKQECDDYFYLPHRRERRGVGGIFALKENSESPEKYFEWARLCSRAFLPSYVPIIEKRRQMAFEEKEKQWQQLRRGRYVEFNLLYDLGTKFGLDSEGRTESILISMPNAAAWAYNFQPEENSPEAAMLHVLKHPRDWIA
ncbi:MAG: oxygen-dependent coproporphyrinogen oxidase [Waddliaceae bacterium]